MYNKHLQVIEFPMMCIFIVPRSLAESLKVLLKLALMSISFKALDKYPKDSNIAF